MKKQIRKGMFETNSSSVHALIIPRVCDRQPHGLYVSHEEFGWEFVRYRSPDKCISYLCQGVWDNAKTTARYVNHLKGKDVSEYVKKAVLGFVKPLEDRGIEVVFDDGYFEPKRNEYGWVDEGYVDHASTLVGNIIHDLSADVDKMIRFIFGGELVTANDNDDYDDFMKLDEIDESRFETMVKYN